MRGRTRLFVGSEQDLARAIGAQRIRRHRRRRRDERAQLGIREPLRLARIDRRAVRRKNDLIGGANGARDNVLPRFIRRPLKDGLRRNERRLLGRQERHLLGLPTAREVALRVRDLLDVDGLVTEPLGERFLVFLFLRRVPHLNAAVRTDHVVITADFAQLARCLKQVVEE